MKRSTLLQSATMPAAVLLACGLNAAPAAAAVVSPVVEFHVFNGSTEVGNPANHVVPITESTVVAPDGSSHPLYSVANYVWDAPAATGVATRVELSGITLDPDPLVAWGLTVTNSSSLTLTYSFTFATPLLPAIVGANTVSSQVTGGITDGNDNGVVTLTPTAANGFLQNPFVDAPATATGAPTGGALSGGLGTTPYLLASSGTLTGPSGNWTVLGTTIAFTLSPGDIASLTGNARIDAAQPAEAVVPLPAAAWLLLSGSALLGLFGRRRKTA